MTAAAVRALRIGCVGYLNARPLVDGWRGPIEFDNPAALCAKLRAGELDIALVSSFEYLRDPRYAIVDGIAIASDGPVYSVIVASSTPVGDATTVELDPASVTSVNLLRCLLPSLPTAGGRAFDAPIPDHTARLLIGDQAIRFRQRHEEEYRITDLGELWRERASLPFVYALWLARPEINATVIAEQLRSLRDENMQRLDELAATQRDFAPEFARLYWREHLKFDFGDREKAGLLTFRSLCEEHGVLPRSQAPLKLV